MNIEKHNQHWKDGYYYPFEKKRDVFNTVMKYISKRLIIAITGLRRTGKTVIMKQTINALIRDMGINRENIFYYSFDEEQPRIEDILSEYERISLKNMHKDKIFIFLDEIQKLEGWQEQLKYYYDNFSIKFVVSGSASLFIGKKTIESLAGRSIDIYLPVLSFKEFLAFRGKEDILAKKKMFENEIKKEFEKYTKRQFIELVNEDEDFIENYVKSIIEKIIYIDIPKAFAINIHELLMRLLKIIASNQGIIIDYNSLSRELGVNRTTISNYLSYLEESFLIKKMYNFSKNRLTSEKKSKKFYLASTSFLSYLSPNAEIGGFMENVFLSTQNVGFFWRTPQHQEVDFVMAKDNSIIPIEIKYGKSIQKKDFRGLLKFCNNFNVKEAHILTNEIRKTEMYDGTKIIFMPLWEFIL